MMSLAAIQQVSRDAAVRACRENRIPFTVEAQDKPNWKAQFKAGRLRFPFPFLGDYVPQGWKRTHRDPLFVDSSGLGREDEPALTVMATINELIAGKAYAIIESGQFQLYLAEYERDDSATGNEDQFVGLTSDEEHEFNEAVQGESQFDPAKIQREGRMPLTDELLRAIGEERERLKNAATADVAIRSDGNRYFFEVKTDQALQWVKLHVLDPHWCGRFLVLNERCAKAIAAGMESAGLRVV